MSRLALAQAFKPAGYLQSRFDYIHSSDTSMGFFTQTIYLMEISKNFPLGAKVTFLTVPGSSPVFQLTDFNLNINLDLVNEKRAKALSKVDSVKSNSPISKANHLESQVGQKRDSVERVLHGFQTNENVFGKSSDSIVNDKLLEGQRGLNDSSDSAYLGLDSIFKLRERIDSDIGIDSTNKYLRSNLEGLDTLRQISPMKPEMSVKVPSIDTLGQSEKLKGKLPEKAIRVKAFQIGRIRLPNTIVAVQSANLVGLNTAFSIRKSKLDLFAGQLGTNQPLLTSGYFRPDLLKETKSFNCKLAEFSSASSDSSVKILMGYSNVNESRDSIESNHLIFGNISFKKRTNELKLEASLTPTFSGHNKSTPYGAGISYSALAFRRLSLMTTIRTVSRSFYSPLNRYLQAGTDEYTLSASLPTKVVAYSFDGQLFTTKNSSINYKGGVISLMSRFQPFVSCSFFIRANYSQTESMNPLRFEYKTGEIEGGTTFTRNSGKGKLRSEIKLGVSKQEQLGEALDTINIATKLGISEAYSLKDWSFLWRAEVSQLSLNEDNYQFQNLASVSYRTSKCNFSLDMSYGKQESLTHLYSISANVSKMFAPNLEAQVRARYASAASMFLHSECTAMIKIKF